MAMIFCSGVTKMTKYHQANMSGASRSACGSAAAIAKYGGEKQKAANHHGALWRQRSKMAYRRIAGMREALAR